MATTYEPTDKALRMVQQLADRIEAKFKPPFVLCGIASGGVHLGKELHDELERRGKALSFYTIKLNKGSDYALAETNLPKELPPSATLLLVDDAIWTGTVKNKVGAYLASAHPSLEYKFVTLLDCGEKADVSLY